MASMAPPLVYVITLNWNRRDDTLGFLTSFSQLAYPNYRIVVVDNGSTDNSVQAIAAHFPGVQQIVNARNLGFAAGANMALRHALVQGAEFMFLVNNDTFVAPDTLDLLVEAALASEAGLAAPKIYYANDPQRIWSVGGWCNRINLEISGCQRGQLDECLNSEPFEVDFITGCGMLIRRECLETVGLFDERFFMYYEDMDYCLRIRSAGYRVLVVPQARMWHRVATSSGGSDSPMERYYMARNSVLFFHKHVRGWRWLFVGPYRLGSAVKWLVRLSLARRWTSTRAYLRGLRDGWQLAQAGRNR